MLEKQEEREYVKENSKTCLEYDNVHLLAWFKSSGYGVNPQWNSHLIGKPASRGAGG